MTTPSSPAPRSAQHPLLIAAAVAVIVFCGAGTAAILGWIPSSIGGTPAATELSEIDRAVLASKLQNGGSGSASNVMPRTLAALDAPGTDAERNAARYRAAQRAENQREDDLRAARDREEKREAAEEAARRPSQQELDRAALYNNGPAPAREPAPRKPAPPPRHAASEAAQERWCNHCGNIESVREVTQRAQGSGLGAAGGAVLGGLLGNQVGGGNGRKLATVAGAVGGAVVGNQVEGNLKATRSYEIRVRLDDGGARTFHQQSAAGWRTGDRVKVVNGTLRPVA
ncbi:glycine zipper 2TM domain-containing protein [Massilia genomosp. 1]|uniref:Glycine zipper 2TM domain-containing protein n=1 Tax=Massilia genomosp. 1 TaxID=2609280 RepID=A0ABX0MH31_9BURK|nr:glycine zipper 2TM domain-containing protein [Massilia genomosp. 1]NHZ61646.1 glycine zipper 2TM domain-containing protein [Massilia genomosp. 1]